MCADLLIQYPVEGLDLSALCAAGAEAAADPHGLADTGASAGAAGVGTEFVPLTSLGGERPVYDLVGVVVRTA